MPVFIQNLRGLQAGIVLSAMVAAGASSAQTYEPADERAVRQTIPKPARCGTTAEPYFYCRFDAAPGANVALELAATKHGPSATLTYTYGDPKSAELLAVVRDFFERIGVDIKSFDRCIWRSHTVPGAMATGDLTLRCQHTDFADRVTYEIFADRTPPGASPTTPGIALMLGAGE
jgi:hypothetical protein